MADYKKDTNNGKHLGAGNLNGKHEKHEKSAQHKQGQAGHTKHNEHEKLGKTEANHGQKQENNNSLKK